MILPAASSCATVPCCGPAAIPREGQRLMATGIVVSEPTPGPARAMLCGVVVAPSEGERAMLTGIVQRALKVVLKLTNNTARSAQAGSALTHEDVDHS